MDNIVLLGKPIFWYIIVVYGILKVSAFAEELREHSYVDLKWLIFYTVLTMVAIFYSTIEVLKFYERFL